jgi:pimeloyl-ACP methyl ester carboxylesterase
MSQALELDGELEGLAGPLPDWFRDVMALPRESRTVDVDGCPIHYLRWGDPSRPGVVLIHGFLAHARCLSFIGALLSTDHHVVAYDVSGYGDSGHRERYDDATRAREMVAVADDARMSRPTLVAHSYGTTVAMSGIEHSAERFAGVIGCDVLMHRPDRLLQFRSQQRITGRFRGDVPKRRVYPDLASGVARYRLAPPQPVENGFLLDYIARHSLTPCEGGWTWKFDPQVYRSDGRDDDWWIAQAERFVRLDAHKAFVYGADSLLFDADTEAYLRELGADFPIVSIPGARHHLMLDRPLAFADTLRTLLARDQSSRRRGSPGGGGLHAGGV